MTDDPIELAICERCRVAFDPGEAHDSACPRCTRELNPGPRGLPSFGALPREARMLERARGLRLTLTLRETADVLNSEGLFNRFGRPWSIPSLSRRLQVLKLGEES